MEIIFVRHAETEKGENADLTRNGRLQAKLLARELKNEKIGEFYSSDLNRTKQTSEIINKSIKKQIKFEKALREFKTETLKKEKKKLTKEEKDKIKKLFHFLDKISKGKDKEKTILIVAHGLTNRLILSYFMNLDYAKLVPFMQKETCINKIEWTPKYQNWRLEMMGNHSHLPRKLK